MAIGKTRRRPTLAAQAPSYNWVTPKLGKSGVGNWGEQRPFHRKMGHVRMLCVYDTTELPPYPITIRKIRSVPPTGL